MAKFKPGDKVSHITSPKQMMVVTDSPMAGIARAKLEKAFGVIKTVSVEWVDSSGTYFSKEFHEDNLVEFKEN